MEILKGWTINELKQKLKEAVAGEAAAVARVSDCERREKDAVAMAQSLSDEIASLQAKHDDERRALDARSSTSSGESERRVAALESGMQTLMDEGSRALETALAIAMREGSARAALADEVVVLRQVSQQAASCVLVEPTSFSGLSSSVPALLRRRVLFSRQIMCKAALCRTQLYGCQRELSSLASSWRCSLAAMQRETATAVLAAVAACQSSRSGATRR